MPLIQARNLSLSMGGALLFDGVDFQMEPGERVCLVGRNGAGKTTFLRILAGDEQPERGEVIRAGGVIVSWLPQEVPVGLDGTVFDVMRTGLRSERHEEDWEAESRLAELAETMKLPPDAEFESLSGGLKRRTLLARALACQPDLVLLDEPTNHLDIAAIEWIEEFLIDRGVSLLFVTHDRAFLRRVATRIIELDRGLLTSWACDYDTYLERRAAQLDAEEKQWAAFDKKLAQEEAWLRQGVKARRTRDEGRVRALMTMRRERAQRRERTGRASMAMQSGATSGQKVIDVVDASFGFGDQVIVDHLETTIWRGDRVGIIGPNGSGKTTLLRLLLGQLAPQTGSVRLGTNLEIAYLDQMRAQIRNDWTLAQNVSPDAEFVNYRGQHRHIHSYLQEFLFRTDRARTLAGMLSGGERNRLLLAKLFLQPANLLVLDEPTNDLDVETLELLEELLSNTEVTLLLVSHDRDFLDRVVTSTLVLEGRGKIGEYAGGYSDWLAQRPAPEAVMEASPPVEQPVDREPAVRRERPRKFLNRERRELDELPAKIEALEAERDGVSELLASPDIYRDCPARIPVLQSEVERLGQELEEAFARWEELESVRIACEESV